jgi:hypothetical protein
MQVELVTNVAEEARCRLSGTHAVEYELRLVCTRENLFRDEMSNYVLYKIATSDLVSNISINTSPEVTE